jgi:hypothetical protein
MGPSAPAWLDGAAIGASALCLVHCLGLPVVAIAAPALAAWLGAEEHVHAALLLLAAPLALLALGRGWRVHHASLPPLLGLLGLLLMVAALAWHDLDQPLTVAGVTLLAGAHLLNWRLHRRAHDG